MAVSDSQVRVRLGSDGAASRAVTAALAYSVGARSNLRVDRLDELLIAVDLLVMVADAPVDVWFDAAPDGLEVTVGPVPDVRARELRATLGRLADRVCVDASTITLRIDV